jgi:hypothetical protein
MIHSRFPRLFLVLAALLVSAAALSTPVAAIPPIDGDFILCSCNFCRTNPNVECQISPSGYTILCSDYSRLHNCKP